MSLEQPKVGFLCELLRKLYLMVDGKLKRSAVLLFYRDPEIIQNGSFIKVGKFDERGRVVYHNDLEESLVCCIIKVPKVAE